MRISPDTATWLTPDERDALNNVLASEVRERSPTSLMSALKDTRVLILAAIQFGFTLGSYGIGIWLPLILKEYHLSTLAIGWIAAIPYLFATIGMLAWAHYVDQKGRRIVNLAIACVLGGAGLVAPVLSGSLALALVGFSAALIGVTAARAIFWTHPDAIPDRRCRRRRPRLHQQHRHGRRVRRALHDGLAEGVLRLLRVRPDGGGRHHGRLGRGVDVAEARGVQGISGA